MLARLVRAVVVAAAMAGLVVGCASPPPQPETMRDPSVNFTNFKTFGWTAGGSVSMGSPSVRNYTEGTLVVHAIDTARNAEVWQGRVSGKVTKGSLEPAAVNQAVAKAMADFPVR